MTSEIRRRVRRLEDAEALRARPLMIVHRDGDDPGGGLYDGPPWLSDARPLAPSETEGKELLIVGWTSEWRHAIRNEV